MAESPERQGAAYVSDIDYLCHHSSGLVPERLDLVALIGGAAPPDVSHGLGWCELGCGRGVTAVVNAALRPSGRFAAVDLMPSHIDFARRLAAAAGVGNLDLVAADFTQAADRVQGPFDYIGAHGVYSWIDAEARASLLAFVDRHLAPGGLFYVSYNAMPGWATEGPTQHLLRALAAGEAGTSAHRVAAAGARLGPLSGGGALSRSAVARDWETYRADQWDAYLAHEYLAPAWQALYVDEVRAAMAGIGLRPIGQTTLADNFDAFVLRDEQRAALAPYEGDRRELVRDFLVDRRFRCDVFGRDTAWIGPQDVRARLLGMPFALLQPATLVDYKFETGAREMSFDNAVTRAIVARLAEGTSLLGHCCGDGIDARDIVASALTLAAAGIIGPALHPPGDPRRLNAALRAFARQPDGSGFLALPGGEVLKLSGDFLDDQASATADGQAWRAYLKSLDVEPAIH